MERHKRDSGSSARSQDAMVEHKPTRPAHPVTVVVYDGLTTGATPLANLIREAGHVVAGVASDEATLAQMCAKTGVEMLAISASGKSRAEFDASLSVRAEQRMPAIVIVESPDPSHIAWIRDRQASANVFGYLAAPVTREALNAAINISLNLWLDQGEHRARIAQLEKNLSQRRMIEQAKWVLVQAQGMTEPQAHEQLQKAARDRRIPLIDVASQVIQQGSLG